MPDRLGSIDDEVRAAGRFAAVGAVVGLAFLVVAAVWTGVCGDVTDTVACGPLERGVLAAAAPVVLFGAAVLAFLRTYRVWRREGTWWGWQGAGWFLLTVMMLTLIMGVPAVLGPALR